VNNAVSSPQNRQGDSDVLVDKEQEAVRSSEDKANKEPTPKATKTVRLPMIRHGQTEVVQG
jgi:hypothetical protein